MTTKSILSRVAIAAVLAGSLGGCMVRGRAWVSTPGVIIVEEPPPPRREVIVVRPGHVWVEGHWQRRGNRWVWRDGYHQRARADHDWVPGRWERRGNGRVWIEGSWRVRAGGRGRGHDHDRGRDRDQDHR